MPTQLPLPTGFRLVQQDPDGDDRCCWHLKTVSASARCPACQHRSSRIHSRYLRTLADLPSVGQSVRLHIQVRRFFCDFAGCSKRTFAEPICDLAARYARRTQRLRLAQTRLSQSVGSRPGVRLGSALAMPTSATTLLRLERVAPLPDRPTPRVLGVDDWAFKKGQRYGTILVDLERHWVVDLLPDRCAESLAQWLKAHPGVEIVSRDRGGCYAEGVRQGAENAVQVADRWHLLKNVGDTLERLLIRQHGPLQEAARQIAVPSTSDGPPQMPMSQAVLSARAPSQSQQERSHRRQRRLARYEQVVALRQQGVGLREIARRLNLSRNTVKKWESAGCFREQPPRARGSWRLAPYGAYLQQRWEAGSHNATELFQEIVAQGFVGSVNVVQRHVQSWRQHKPASRKRLREAPPSARCVRWWLLGHYSQEADAQQRQVALVERLCQLCPVVQTVQDLTRRFTRMVKEKRAADLDTWLEDATRSQISEMVAFAQGLRQDREAVEAALSTTVSNGQTEGQVNRLKMKKRQMYGRANFDLLRRRVLQPT